MRLDPCMWFVLRSFGGPGSEDESAELAGGAANDRAAAAATASGATETDNPLATTDMPTASADNPVAASTVTARESTRGSADDAVPPLRNFGGTLPKAAEPDEEGPAKAPSAQPPPRAEAAMTTEQRQQLAAAAEEVGSSQARSSQAGDSAGSGTGRLNSSPKKARPAEAAWETEEAAAAASAIPDHSNDTEGLQRSHAVTVGRMAADSRQLPLSRLPAVEQTASRTGALALPLDTETAFDTDALASASAAGTTAADGAGGSGGGTEAITADESAARARASSAADDPFVLGFGRMEGGTGRRSRIASKRKSVGVSDLAAAASAQAAATQDAAAEGAEAGSEDAVQTAGLKPEEPDVVPPPTLPFYRSGLLL